MNRSVGYPLCFFLGGLIYSVLPQDAAKADPQKFYFCESSNNFFPYVQTCAGSWRVIDPKAMAAVTAPPPAPAQIPLPEPATSTAASPPEPVPQRIVAFPKGMAPPPPASPANAYTPVLQPAVLQQAAPAAPVPTPPVKGPVVFAYGDNPTIVCAVSQLCDVALQPGEKINHVTLGDPDHWKVDQASEGNAPNETQHLIIQPSTTDLETSMIVLTRLRTYHVRLESHAKDYMLQVTFSYPEAAAAAGAKPAEEAGAGDDGLVKVGNVTYVKGREPKMLVTRAAQDEPPQPEPAPRPEVAAQAPAGPVVPIGPQ